MKEKQSQFWQEKKLEALSPQEWEALCDGCGKCCLHKLEDMDTGKIYFTNVICKYSDRKTCQCTDYENRHENVPSCVYLTPKMAREANWLPKSCAYRKLALGQDLPWWHPLISGDPKTVIDSSNSVQGKIAFEDEVNLDDLEDMVVNWFD
jgi:uncharacterized cysteine cluster protein YcgN (CxxCxxCC family)